MITDTEVYCEVCRSPHFPPICKMPVKQMTKVDLHREKIKTEQAKYRATHPKGDLDDRVVAKGYILDYLRGVGEPRRDADIRTLLFGIERDHRERREESMFVHSCLEELTLEDKISRLVSNEKDKNGRSLEVCYQA